MSGNAQYSEWDIVQASGLKDGENLLTFNRSAAAARIRLELDYVESVRFGIKLPDTVLIEVNEIEVTYAVKDTKDEWWLISSGGKVVGKVTEEDIEAFSKGVNIGTTEEEEWTMPGKLEIMKSDDISEIRLTIQEGKFHQVKRMMEAVGNTVTYLKRISMGPLVLPEDLGIGEYRRLSEEEIILLKGIDNV